MTPTEAALAGLRSRRLAHEAAGAALRAETAATIRAALDAGMTAVEVARQLGISRARLYQLLDHRTSSAQQ